MFRLQDGCKDEELRRADRKRKKKACNEEWKNPHDPDAEVAKMKDGATHLAYKAEQAATTGPARHRRLGPLFRH
jgi:hypothetical protein